MEIRTFLDFMIIAEKLKCSTRHAYTSSGRKESVAEHSWRAALMAFLLQDEFPDLDMEKVMSMCLIHDLGEAVTGDIPTFEKTSQDEDVENKAVESLIAMFSPEWQTRLRNLYEEMEARQTPEAKLYKALDKLEALIQHNESDLSTWIPLEYDLQMTHGVEECSFCAYIQALRDAVREDSKQKIKDGK